MGKRIEYEGQVHEFPDDFTDADIQFALADYTRQKSQPPQVNLTQAPIDVLKGVGKGALSTGAHIGDMVQRMAGTPRILERPEVQSMITPTNPWESAGYALEKGGEFMLPGGLVNRGVGAVQAATAGARGANLLSLATRAGLEGVASGGVAGLQTGGDPKAMEEAALSAAGITGALGAVAPLAGNILERRAVNQYGKVLQPTMRKTKYTARAETIPGALDRGVTAWSMEGLVNRAEKETQHWGQEVEKAWSSIPQDTPLALEPILQDLTDSVAKAHIGGVNLGPAADIMVKHADDMKDVLTKVAKANPQTGALEITVGDLRKAKKFAEEIAADAGAYEGKTIADKSIDRTYQTVADSARGQINPRYPQVEQANQQYHFWKGFEKVADETAQRRVGQERGLLRYIGNLVGAGAIGSAAHSAGAGPVGDVIATLIGSKAADLFQQAATSTKLRTASAVLKHKLAESLAQGNKGGVEFYLREILRGGTGAAITIPTSKELPVPRQP